LRTTMRTIMRTLRECNDVCRANVGSNRKFQMSGTGYPVTSHGLTDVVVRALQAPEKGQKMCWCRSLAGFGVRVPQGGTNLVLTGQLTAQD